MIESFVIFEHSISENVSVHMIAYSYSYLAFTADVNNKLYVRRPAYIGLILWQHG